MVCLVLWVYWLMRWFRYRNLLRCLVLCCSICVNRLVFLILIGLLLVLSLVICVYFVCLVGNDLLGIDR